MTRCRSSRTRRSSRLASSAVASPSDIRPSSTDSGTCGAPHALDVAHEHEPTIVDQRDRLAKDGVQIIDVRKVLDDRIQDHGIEALAGRQRVGAALDQPDAPGWHQLWELALDERERGARDVGADVGLAVGREPKQQHPGPAPDLEHAPRPPSADPGDRGLDLLEHLLCGQRKAGVATVPAHRVERDPRQRARSSPCRANQSRLIDDVVVRCRMPRRHQLCHLGLRARGRRDPCCRSS